MKALPYTRKRSSSPAKRPKKRPAAARRVQPDIYVRVPGTGLYSALRIPEAIEKMYAKAHIRVRRGCYRFLVWREGNKIREFYLGRLRQAAPTPGPRAPEASSSPAPTSTRSPRRVRK
jgi:hypothetical protein